MTRVPGREGISAKGKVLILPVSTRPSAPRWSRLLAWTGLALSVVVTLGLAAFSAMYTSLEWREILRPTGSLLDPLNLIGAIVVVSIVLLVAGSRGGTPRRVAVGGGLLMLAPLAVALPLMVSATMLFPPAP